MGRPNAIHQSIIHGRSAVWWYFFLALFGKSIGCLSCSELLAAFAFFCRGPFGCESMESQRSTATGTVWTSVRFPAASCYPCGANAQLGGCLRRPSAFHNRPWQCLVSANAGCCGSSCTIWHWDDAYSGNSSSRTVFQCGCCCIFRFSVCYTRPPQIDLSCCTAVRAPEQRCL